MHASYLTQLFNLEQREQLANALASFYDEHPNLAFVGTGISGIFPLGLLAAMRPQANIILVRKEVDNSHSSCDVETTRSFNEYAIVDDLVSSGKTLSNIVSKVGRPDKCKFLLLYNDFWSSHFEQIPNAKVFGLTKEKEFRPIVD